MVGRRPFGKSQPARGRRGERGVTRQHEINRSKDLGNRTDAALSACRQDSIVVLVGGPDPDQ
jgi:hypothetical protein